MKRTAARWARRSPASAASTPAKPGPGACRPLRRPGDDLAVTRPYNACMNEQHASFRSMEPRGLDQALRDARRRTLALFDALAGAGYHDSARVPRLAILNPPLWELGHIAWFAEWFVLRA